MSHAVLGPPIRNWQKNGAISPRAKAAAMAAIIASPALSYVLAVPRHILLIQIAILGGVSLFILTRPNR